ncbi:hypothetical protein PanWU01x14_288580 [Parasponia andersonii]|uniref:Uncharacterized protein n=1 Tax=Parasponia andersonii TaxID=3476 RepID=A0A2P5AYJ2_PARAD|nr:hypothetical protein PanWU01x14_288580 [Parasponia andersonii]
MMENLMKSRAFKNLFDTLEFGDEARKKATHTIFKISQRFGPQCCSINYVVGRIAKKDKDTITFSKKDAQLMNFSHNKPLCVEAKDNSTPFKRALVDNGLAVNLMTWQVFKAAKITESKLIMQTVGNMP